MKILSIIIIFIIAVSCEKGQESKDAQNKREVDELKVEFYDNAKSRNISTINVESFEFVTKEKIASLNKDHPNAIGLCSQGYTRKIYLLKTFWESTDSFYKKQLIFHELGHCALTRDHDNTVLDYNKSLRYFNPASIMYPVAPNSRQKLFVESHLGDFIDELYSRNKTVILTYGVASYLSDPYNPWAIEAPAFNKADSYSNIDIEFASNDDGNWIITDDGEVVYIVE
jgi:hypothetical protein